MTNPKCHSSINLVLHTVFVTKVNMIVEDRKKLQEIISKMSCRTDFICVEMEHEILCKVKDEGVFLGCFTEKRSHCDYAVPLDRDYFCSCPIRVFLCNQS